MGMAASQARLLAITARIHDVEYQAQAIQNAKMGLANLSDQAYNEYLAALDAETLTIKDYQGNSIVANFNTICSKNAVQPAGDFKYALKDSKGRLIVSDDIKDKYDKFMDAVGSNDPYAFAFFMTNPEFVEKDANANCIPGRNGERPEKAIYLDTSAINETVYSKAEESEIESISLIKNKMNELWDKIKDKTTDKNIKNAEQYEVLGIYEKGGKSDSEIEELMNEYKVLEETLKHRVYRAYSEDIYTELAGDDYQEGDFKEDDFNYYVSIFKQIQASGGCISIADYDGVNGDAANDSDWLQMMLKCGKITIETATFDKVNGAVKFNATSVSSDTYLEYATTSSIDKKALAKAEAEYEHACHDINQKDKKFDLDLSKLETERNALTTEYDSVKKVIQENIERTFGIFS